MALLGLQAGSSESWAPAQSERKGGFSMLLIVLMTTLEQWGLTLPPATSLHPAVLAMQPHLPSLSVGTLSICQLQSHAVCPVLSGPLAPGCVGWANRPQALSSPQSHHPVKPDADPGMKLLYCLLSLREGSPALSNLTQPFKTRENSAHAHTQSLGCGGNGSGLKDKSKSI